jgi:hypothetical protein
LEVTSEALLTSSDPSIVKTKAQGIISGFAIGQALITATWQCLVTSRNATVQQSSSDGCGESAADDEVGPTLPPQTNARQHEAADRS